MEGKACSSNLIDAWVCFLKRDDKFLVLLTCLCREGMFDAISTQSQDVLLLKSYLLVKASFDNSIIAILCKALLVKKEQFTEFFLDHKNDFLMVKQCPQQIIPALQDPRSYKTKQIRRKHSEINWYYRNWTCVIETVMQGTRNHDHF